MAKKKTSPRPQGQTAKDKAGAVKKEHDEELTNLEEEISAESSESGEESAASETTEPQQEESTQTPAEGEEHEAEEQEEKTVGEEEDVRQLSAKAQKRYRKLVNERNQWREEAQRLKATPSGNYQSTEDLNNLNLQEETYEEAVARQARNVVQQEIRQREGYEKAKAQREYYQNDLKEVEEKYPELNPDSKNYNQEMDELIASYYDTASRRDPETRLKDVASKVVSVAKKGQQGKVDELAKKASQQAIKTTESEEQGEPDVMAKLEKAETLEELQKLEKELS